MNHDVITCHQGLRLETGASIDLFKKGDGSAVITLGGSDAATRAAKKLRVAELRAALEAAGADSKGLKPALVERLVEVRRRASGRRRTPPTLSPVAFSETDEAEPPSPAKKRVWGLRRRFSPRKLRTRRPQPSQ